MSRETKAKSAVLRIFNLPPSSAAELKQILSEVDVEYVRDEIFERIEQGSFDEADFAIFAEVIQEIGIGSHREHLVSLVLNENCDIMVRKYALVALTQDASDELIVELGQLGPEVLQNLTDLPFIDLLYRLQMDPEDASHITALFEASQGDNWEYVLLGLEKIRKEMGIPAHIVYSDVLACEELEDIRAQILELVVNEANEEGLTLLTHLRDSARSNGSRQAFQKALLRLGTRNIEEEKSPEIHKGVAYIGSCDGQGAYLLIGRIRVTPKNTTTVHLCIRSAGEVRDAFVLPMLEEGEFKDILSKLFAESPGDFAQISLEQARIFVQEALRRMAVKGVELSKKDRYAIDMFGPRETECSLPWLDRRASSKEHVPGKFADLLLEPLFESWFFDAGDFFGYGIEKFEGTPDEKWYEETSKRLAQTPIRDRLLGMARHMTLFYLLKSDIKRAQMFSDIFEDAEENFAESTLLQGILRKTVEQSLPSPDSLSSFEMPLAFGDTDLRRLFKTEFFSELKHPKGIHLARLDYAEAAFHSLESALLNLPGERRPREESKYAMAFEIGRTFTNIVVKNKKDDIEGDVSRLARRISQLTHLNLRESESIISTSFDNLISFFDEICASCPVGCVERPAARMNDHFYALYHPAEELFEKLEWDTETGWQSISGGDKIELSDWANLKLGDPNSEDELCGCGSGKKYAQCCKFN